MVSKRVKATLVVRKMKFCLSGVYIHTSIFKEAEEPNMVCNVPDIKKLITTVLLEVIFLVIFID